MLTLFACLLTLISTALSAQISLNRSILNPIKKEQWIKSEQSLQKALKKDPLNPVARYIYARWYFSPSNPKYHIDSAYLYLLGAIYYYGVMSSVQSVIISDTLNTIRNIGTLEKHFYFAKKYVPEANIYIILYYDEYGDMHRKQIYKASEYDQILPHFEFCLNGELMNR